MNALSISRESVRQALKKELSGSGIIPKESLEKSCQIADTQGFTLGAMLTRAGLISDNELARLYCKVLALPAYQSSMLTADANLNSHKEAFLRSALIVPLSETDEAISLAIANPEDAFSLEAFLGRINKTPALYIATQQQVIDAIDQLAGKSKTKMEGIVEVLSLENEQDSNEELLERLKDQAIEAPVVRLVNLIIERAIESRASDVHIEPVNQQLRIRYRIDGILRVTESPPGHSSAAIISRIKLMARMDIAERRLPQDGAFQLRVQGKLIDIRVSSTPTHHGESIVLRILDQSAINLDIADLGFSQRSLEELSGLLGMPSGIILVTGPTGSGKTTTLYAALNILNTDERKIMTVEDPVEYQLTGINQVQVKPDIGLSFPHALRSIVRQDPDVIMIGEMRDQETAKTAIQSALTGHLVLSTLHTNDAGSSITRLLDMGIDNYLVTSTINAIVAQRLVRRLCDHCKAPFPLHTELRHKLFPASDCTTVYQASGCERCEGTGYTGRIVINEIMHSTKTIKDGILRGLDGHSLQELAMSEGMISMRTDGLNKVQAGITTIEEVSRVTLV